MTFLSKNNDKIRRLVAAMFGSTTAGGVATTTFGAAFDSNFSTM
jgi:hypothetical protein